MAGRIEHLDINDRWTPTATWKVGTVATDPSQIIVRQLKPDGTASVITTASSPSTLTPASQPLARISTGSFQLIPGIQLDSAGYWKARFEGTGAAEATEELTCIADPTEFVSGGGVSAKALVTLSETKDWLEEQTESTADDLEIVRVINDVSDTFAFEAGREFKVTGTNPQTRDFFVDELACYRLVEVGDMANTTGLTVKLISQTDWTTAVNTYQATDFIVLPEIRGSADPITKLAFKPTALMPWPGQRVEVTGNFGFPAVPGRVRQAVLEAVADVLDRDVEHYRQDEQPTGMGDSNVVLSPSAQFMFLPLPPRALAVARSYQGIGVG